MQNNLLDYLDATAMRIPDKKAFYGVHESYTFLELQNAARAMGTVLAQYGFVRKPVVICMEKGAAQVAAFLGTLYSGNFYVPIDATFPPKRIERLLKKIQPFCMIFEKRTALLMESLCGVYPMILWEDVRNQQMDEVLLANRRKKMLDTDPAYVVFTSGSTGEPKGVIANHRNVLDYMEQLSEVLQVTEDTIFGNQAPLYFDACLKELYTTLKHGAATYFIPQELFRSPLELLAYLKQNQINTICWVPSALTMISSMHVLEKEAPIQIHTIAFGGERFPIPQLVRWQHALPKTRFIHLYGPTEATGMSCYYEVKQIWEEGKPLPIGQPFPNTDAFLFKDGVESLSEGELYLRGSCVTLGYYQDKERTEESFVQNPLHTNYAELVYKTGDRVCYNENGELVFLGRYDTQIKHMGHRIELQEIEVEAHTVTRVNQAACFYYEEKEKIVLYYVGEIEKQELAKELQRGLPRYMMPNAIRQLPVMPLTPNGKVDRRQLRELFVKGTHGK